MLFVKGWGLRVKPPTGGQAEGSAHLCGMDIVLDYFTFGRLVSPSVRD